MDYAKVHKEWIILILMLRKGDRKKRKTIEESVFQTDQKRRKNDNKLINQRILL